MSNNLVVVKFPAETVARVLDMTMDLQTGETVTSAVIASVSPLGLTASVPGVTPTLVNLSIGVGADGQSYGVQVDVTLSSARVVSKVVAVVCNSQIAYDYQNVNLDAFSDLIGELEAGQAAVGNVSFMFPLGFDAAGGSIAWDLIDQNGVQYSSGTSFAYLATPLSNAVKVTAQAVVNVPSEALPTLDGQNYQVRWKLVIDGRDYFAFEALRVTSINTAPVGVEDVVELEGADIPVSIIFAEPYDTVAFELYTHDNQRVTPSVPVNATQSTKVSDGWYYKGELTGYTLTAGLEPFTILWTGKNSNRPIYTDRQTGRVFVVNPSILQAVADLRVNINKAHTTIAHREDMIFTEAILLAYLRHGRDYFNGAGAGMLTSFTMTNAQGSIREFWLRSSMVAALRAQYLAEGEKSFNFSGQAISLDVDRTQYYQSLADTLKSELDNELKPFKQNLIKKGIIDGDGNLDPNGGIRLRPGAIGTVGITITPATGWSKYGARWRMR